jgi:hypothetical protein
VPILSQSLLQALSQLLFQSPFSALYQLLFQSLLQQVLELALALGQALVQLLLLYQLQLLCQFQRQQQQQRRPCSRASSCSSTDSSTYSSTGSSTCASQCQHQYQLQLQLFYLELALEPVRCLQDGSLSANFRGNYLLRRCRCSRWTLRWAVQAIDRRTLSRPALAVDEVNLTPKRQTNIYIYIYILVNAGYGAAPGKHLENALGHALRAVLGDTLTGHCVCRGAGGHPWRRTGSCT